jgi:hypothetical protein
MRVLAEHRTARDPVGRGCPAHGRSSGIDNRITAMPTNPAGLVYGTIAVGALLAAESARQETYTRTIIAVAIALILYWLSYSYAEFTGRRIENQQAVTLTGILEAAAREMAVLLGAAMPFFALIICWVFGASLNTAVTIGIWTSAAMVVAIEVLIGLRAELTGRQLVLQSAFGAFLGLMIIALRIVLH